VQLGDYDIAQYAGAFGATGIRINSIDEFENAFKQSLSDSRITIIDVPVDWEALEDAFENNAPEVHSYLHVGTGEVLRVVDGIADPQMHSRIAADAAYVRVEPVSSREQYRWMERFIQMLDPGDLRDELVLAIDGRGAFRRFKDVLMVNATERERWFAFRSERLRVNETLFPRGIDVVLVADDAVVAIPRTTRVVNKGS